MPDVPSLAIISIIAVGVAIVIGVIRSDINIGVLSLVFAFAIGLIAPEIGVGKIAELFPTELILMLIGVTLLFGMARQNGTLEWLAQIAIVSARRKPIFLPLIFFLITFLISTIGPGNIAAVAVIAPIGMAVAARAGINPMLMAIMICTGANAGAFSPITPTGVINTGLLHQIGITDPAVPLKVFWGAAALQSITALAAWLLFGRLQKSKGTEELNIETEKLDDWLLKQTIQSPSTANVATIIVIGLMLIAVLLLDVPIAAAALMGALLLALPRFAILEESIKKIPWSVVLLIGGISILVQMMEETGGIELATSLMTRYAIPGAVNGMLAFTTGILSAFSSSSGVVIPLYIPLLPSLASNLGVDDLVAMVTSVDIGSHLVDVSPLSSLGALCLATIQDEKERNRLFKQLLLWGLAMAVVGGLLAFIFLDVL